ncbi:unnamed protein product [Pelagomonas calceolata]|uniref:F-box domain-containing protein n=1 Tax=Pelagomonas calceolata TaxID=35677 RepID=A0A8J2SLI4_9STRA|nr:unnamed protein product [Pelagomonas calceolata]
MAKKARTSRPRRAAAPADGFAAPPQEMDLEEEEPAPRRRAAPLVPLEHVIAKCPRAELEDLILASAKNNEPVTRGDLEAAAARHAPPPKAVIELGNEREGTGAFDAIDTQCLGAILEQLTTSDRLTMATVVCKSWRRLQMAKGLWTSFCLNEAPLVLQGTKEPVWEPVADVLPNHRYARQYSRLRTGPALQLLDWVIDKNAVVELGISTGNDALSVGAVMAALRAFPSLRKLALDGKQILAKVLRTKYPCQATLRTLVVGTSVPSAGKGAFAAFLGCCTRLETLCAPADLTAYSCLEAAAATWKASRGGAPPLLTHLKLYGYAGYNADPFALPAAVGDWFANLESLSFSTKTYGDGHPPVPTFAKLPRLKHLHVGPLAGYDYHLSDEGLLTLVATLMQAAPNVEHLFLQHGKAWGSGDNTGDLPKLNGALARLPSTLTTLDLMNVVLQAKDFDEHSLKALRLRDCEIFEEDMIFGEGDGNAALTHLESAWGIETDEVPWPEPEEE